MSNIELNGEWWLPDSKVRISGTLSISDEQGIHLSLIGLFEDPRIEYVNYPIIYGRTKDKDLTLFSCNRTKYSFGTNYPTSEYSISYIFEGNHFIENIECLLIEKINVNFSYFSQWGTLSTFRGRLDSYDINFGVEQHDNITVNLNKASLTIRQITQQELSRSKICIELESLIQIAFQEPISFPVIYGKYLTPLQFFISLLTTRFNQIVSVNYCGNDFSLKIHHRTFKPNEKIEVLHPREMFFSLDEIKDNLQNILNNWFELYNQIPEIINLYFILEENSKNYYLEQQFLFSAQFLEGYYKRIENPMNNISLKEIIKYFFNQPLNLFIIDEFSKALCSSNQDEDLKFIRKRLIEKISQGIQDTRNYYSHYGHKQKNIFEGSKLFRVTQIIRFLSQSILLNKLGLSKVSRKICNSEFCYFVENIKSFELFS